METRPEVLSFETMEPIYAVVKVENGIGNQLDIRVVVEGDVVNKGPGGLVMNKTVDIEARKPLFLSLAIAFPGRYRVEAVIIDPSGNQLDSRSKSITVTGEPPRPEDEESEREGDLG